MPAAPALVTSRRYDRGGGLLRAHKRASDGALLAECIPSREGILDYARADGTIRRELVTRQAVLDTARTAPRSAMTLDHPKAGFINADSHKDLNVGDVDGSGSVEEDAQGGFVKLKIAVRRRDALDAIDGGMNELSLGYEATVDETPGEHPIFGHYDAAQVGRVVNHLALVPKGRAITDLRVDSSDAYQRAPVATAPREDAYMKPALVALLTLLGVRNDNEDAALAAGYSAAEKLKTDAARRKDADEAIAEKDKEIEKKDEELTAEKKALVAIQAELDKLKGSSEVVQAELDTMKASEAERADKAELARLQGVATKVGVKHDGLKLPALRLAIAKSRVDSVDEKTAPARVDGILAAIEADAGKRADRWDFSGPKREDAKREDGADPANARRDSHFNPALSHADDARKAATPGSSR